jgi:hypothetical protein
VLGFGNGLFGVGDGLVGLSDGIGLLRDARHRPGSDRGQEPTGKHQCSKPAPVRLVTAGHGQR